MLGTTPFRNCRVSLRPWPAWDARSTPRWSGPAAAERPATPRPTSKITRAAAELILLRGFDKTTVDEVAARAGVGKATVYRRWPSKEDLAVAAMESLYTDEFPEADTGSIVTDLRASYRAVLAFVNTPTGAGYFRMSIMESIRDERIGALYRASTERRELQPIRNLPAGDRARRGTTRRRHRHARCSGSAGCSPSAP